MNALTIMLIISLAGLLMLSQWWVLRRQWQVRFETERARHQQSKARAAELLQAAKQQVTDLQHQLAGARLEAARASRQRPTAPVAVTTATSAVDESLLLMLQDGDQKAAKAAGKSRKGGASDASEPSEKASGFADTAFHL